MYIIPVKEIEEIEFKAFVKEFLDNNERLAPSALDQKKARF